MKLDKSAQIRWTDPVTEYKYVSLPSVGKQIRSDDVDRYATEELTNVYVNEGWEPIAVTRPAGIGPIGFLLRRDA